MIHEFGDILVDVGGGGGEAKMTILNLAQYAFLFSTSLYESVTVKEVRISSLVGILFSLVISFLPSILYLARRVLQ